MKARLLCQQLAATELLLEAASGDERRLRSALYAMAVLSGADIGVLAVGRAGGGSRLQLTTESVDGAGTIAGGQHTFLLLGTYGRAVLGHAPGVLHAADELLPRQKLEQTAFYRDWLGAVAMHDARVAYLPLGHGEVLTVAFASYAARPGGQGFRPECLAAVERLLPQLRRVCELSQRLDSLAAVSDAAIARYDRCHVGVVVLDDEGRVVFSNQAAHGHFERSDGLCLRGGCLDVADGHQSAALMQAIRGLLRTGDACTGGAPRLLPVSRAGARPLSLALCRYQPRGRAARGYVVLMIHDPDHPPVERGEAIRSIYALSQSEADLVCALAAAESLDHYAARSGCSLESVRSRLKRVFRKTGTTRQVELVELVLSGPAAMVHWP